MNRTISALQATILALAMVLGAPGYSADWKDSDCRKDKDESGNTVEVCRDKESIGIFWNEGSFVNGWCDDRAYEIEYKGIKKTEALSWVKYYCD
jgi:GH18 family chitinase